MSNRYAVTVCRYANAYLGTFAATSEDDAINQASTQPDYDGTIALCAQEDWELGDPEPIVTPQSDGTYGVTDSYCAQWFVEVDADNEDDAIDKALDIEPGYHLCHECSDRIEMGDIWHDECTAHPL